MRSRGFLSARQLQFQILYIFNSLISTKTLNTQRKLLSEYLFKLKITTVIDYLQDHDIKAIFHAF